MIYYYNNDSLKELDNFIKKKIKVDKIITSPPYNIMRKTSELQYDKYQDGLKTNKEYIKWIINYFKKFSKIINKDGCILWNMSYSSSSIDTSTLMYLLIAEIITKTDFTLADTIVWKKKNVFHNNVSKNKLTRLCEFIFVFVKKEDFKTFETNKKVKSYRKTGQKIFYSIPNIIEAKNNDGINPYNKATFSSDLIQKLFNIYIKEKDIILDPFAGIGTVGKVAKKNNNDCHLIELSKNQLEYSKNIIESIKC